MARRRPRLPYLALGSPAAARFWDCTVPASLTILARVWLPGVVVAFVAAFAIGMSAVWATLIVLGLALSAWLQRHVSLIPASVLHSPRSRGGALVHGLDVVRARSLERTPLDACFAVDFACLGREQQVWTTRAGWVDSRAWQWAQAGIALLLIFGQAPLPLAVLSVLWLATWVAVYRGQSLVKVQASWTAALLVSAAAMSQTVF